MLPMTVIEIRETKMREVLAKDAEDIGRYKGWVEVVCCLELIELGVVPMYLSEINQNGRAEIHMPFILWLQVPGYSIDCWLVD